MKVGPHAGKRGFVKATDGQRLLIQLTDEVLPVQVKSEEITNFSLAARKAWVTGPDRAVGRRKGSKVTDRVTVTFRVDRELWELFQELEESGDIEDRNGIINDWLRQKLTALRAKCPKK